MNATIYILQNPSLLMNLFAGELPAVVFFFGISHLWLRQYITVKLRPWVVLAYLVAPALVLALLGWEMRAEKYGNGVKLLVPLILSVLSCAALYYQEWKRQSKNATLSLNATATTESADPLGKVLPPQGKGSIAESVQSQSEIRVSGTIFCDQCGTASKPNAKYCHNCGHRICAPETGSAK